MKAKIAAALAAALMVLGGALTAPAGAAVTRDGNVFTAAPATANAVTTIDGYLFVGMPYYDSSAAVDSAVELWWELAADPNYQPLPPITSVSVPVEVSGTVGDGGDDGEPPERSSWG